LYLYFQRAQVFIIFIISSTMFQGRCFNQFGSLPLLLALSSSPRFGFSFQLQSRHLPSWPGPTPLMLSTCTARPKHIFNNNRCFCLCSKQKDDDSGEIFDTVETYKATLPKRMEQDWFKKLYEHPYFSYHDELDTVARHLEDNARSYLSNRDYIRYMCSGTHTGKTSSVLPCFLQSAESKQKDALFCYIYLACTNNDNCNYVSKSQTPLTDPELQGGAFIFNCIKAYLDNLNGLQDPSTVPTESNYEGFYDTWDTRGFTMIGTVKATASTIFATRSTSCSKKRASRKEIEF